MSALLAHLQAAGWAPHPGGVRRGPATLLLTPATFHTRLTLLDVAPKARGQGLGRAALGDLTAAADATGTRLVLSASPFGPGGLDTPALVALYSGFGWRRIGTDAEGAPVMARAPLP